MNVYALFDNVSYEKIDMTLLRPGNKTNVVEITYLSSVPDNIRESFDIGIKEAYLLLLEYSNQIPEKISVWYRGFDKNFRGNSTDLAFALALTAYFVNNGSLKMPDGIDMISATGIIRKDGGINKVIGLKNKILAAVDINSAHQKHLLFYPEENREELELLRKEDIELDTKIFESGVKLMPVKTLRDAFENMGFTNKLKSELAVMNKRVLVIIGSALLICVSVVFFMSIFNENKKMPSVTVAQNPVTAAPGSYNAVETTDAMNKCTPTPTFIQQNKNTPIIPTGSTTAPKAATEKPAATIAVRAVPPSIKLNDDNSITITFREPVKNTLAVDGALNTENYKLLDGNSRQVSESDGGVPKISATEPGFKYKVEFPKLRNVDSINFMINVSNIGSSSEDENLPDKISFSFKTNDTKKPCVYVGPRAYFKSGWILRLVFDEEMDKASTEDPGNYTLVDNSASSEEYFLSELDDVDIKLLNDGKTVEISLPDIEPEKDSLKVSFVTDNSKQKNMLDKEYLDVPMVISN